MGNILDYVRWRGDLSFDAAPFNEVDSLVFTQLAFNDLYLFKGEGESPTLFELESRFFAHFDRSSYSLGIYFPKKMGELLTLCATCERFREVRLLDAEVCSDADRKIQFAAMTFMLPDKSLYVAYRGTDDSLHGWYESLSIGIFDSLPIHDLAKAYLERTVSTYRFAKLRIGGHSKGGHLAVLAAISLPSRYHRRILAIDNIDGPGFRFDISENENYLALRDRIFSVTPHMAIIGALLCGYGKADVVCSDAKGLFQHDVFSWHIEGKSFVRLDTRSNESARVERSLKGWLEKVEDADRLKFLDAIFSVLTSSGAKTISEINEDKLGSAYQFSKTMLTFDKETRDVVSRAILLLLRERKLTLRSEKEAARLLKKNKKSSDTETESDDGVI